MAVLIDLVHVRKARRLFQLLLERNGLRHYLEGDRERAFKIDPTKLESAVTMCSEWACLRTGTTTTEETVDWLRKDLRRMLIQAVAESMVRAGY
ncbi:MAG: hypothetical protein HY904_18360 [Deltaproteobacteria bacterium]|nr:hypothetical protein [Deltaproteobacteria bacterium]